MRRKSKELRYGTAVKMLGEMPKCFRLEMNFKILTDSGDFGLVLRADRGLDKYYTVKLEPRHDRLCFDRIPRVFDAAKHVQVDIERFCLLEIGKENTLTLICEESVLEVYVNDRVAMSTRMFDFKEGDFGIYSHNM